MRSLYWFPLAKIVRAMISEGKWPMGRINAEILNMLLIAVQAVKFLDLLRLPQRPATSIQSKLNGGRNGNILKIGGTLPTRDTIETKKRKKNQVTKRKIVRKKWKTKKRRKSGKALNVSLSEEPENKTSFSLPL